MIFSENQIDSLLDKLLQIPFETEWFEFKRTMEDTGTAKLGEYFSALSNEANLKNQPYGWLIFGIDDKTHEIIGTNYRNRDKKKLDDIKQDIANKC
jgi:ATP-dependent DNA helicase RecG